MVGHFRVKSYSRSRLSTCVKKLGHPRWGSQDKGRWSFMLESLSRAHRALRSGGIRLEREYETISKNMEGLEGYCIISKVSLKQISALRYNTKFKVPN